MFTHSKSPRKEEEGISLISKTKDSKYGSDNSNNGGTCDSQTLQEQDLSSLQAFDMLRHHDFINDPSLRHLLLENFKEYTPAMKAIATGSLSYVKSLINKGNVNEKAGWNQSTVLMVAAASNLKERVKIKDIVKYLCEDLSAEIDLRNSVGISRPPPLKCFPNKTSTFDNHLIIYYLNI